MGARVGVLLGDRRRTVVALAGASVISGFSEAAMIAVLAQIGVALAGNRHQGTKLPGIGGHASVNALLAAAFGLAVFRLLMQFPLSYLPSRIAAEVQSSMRKRLFTAFSLASWGVQSSDREGQLQETMSGQVMQATSGALQATSLITSSLTFLVLLGVAFALSPIAAAGVFIAAVGMFAVLRPLRKLAVRRSRALSKAQVRYSAAIAESNRLAEETQVFGVAAAQRKRLDGYIDTARDLFYSSQLIGRLVPSMYQSLIYVLLVLGLVVLKLAGGGHTASLGAVILLLVRAGSNGQSVQSAYQGLSQSMPFIERTQNAAERYLASVPPDGEEHLERIEIMEFEHVDFSYRQGTPTLKDLSFVVAHNEAIGVIGPSGAGKSTLIQLLLRLRSPEAGRYLVNGQEVTEFRRADWHRLVSYVPQSPRLLHASVAENIRYFRDMPDGDVERAAKLAKIDEDVVGWPKGYDTLVGPRADAVSGGQAQRICLARALAARPEVLVLDEPTSALDPHSETLIQESLTALRSNLTMFIIAHRMSTLDICDRVMVIQEGRLAAFDSRLLLQQENQYYRSASRIAAGAPGGVLP
jgi:ABC-type multidrug transport system fused ATPase/permease subunit